MSVVNLQDYMQGVIASGKVVYNLEIAMDALGEAIKYLNKDNAVYKNVVEAFRNTDMALFELIPEEGLHNDD